MLFATYITVGADESLSRWEMASEKGWAEMEPGESGITQAERSINRRIDETRRELSGEISKTRMELEGKLADGMKRIEDRLDKRSTITQSNVLIVIGIVTAVLSFVAIVIALRR